MGPFRRIKSGATTILQNNDAAYAYWKTNDSESAAALFRQIAEDAEVLAKQATLAARMLEGDEALTD